MVGHCVWIMMVLGIANQIAALAQQAVGINHAVPEIAALEPELESLYRDLHEHPELAFHEQRTAATLADRLRALGFEVTTQVGGTGVVAMLRNGSGPVVMLRTELDALPVEEKTGLPFASKAKELDSEGKVVPVAHACGHDLHMTGWYGAATIMARRRTSWHGTLIWLASLPRRRPAGRLRCWRTVYSSGFKNPISQSRCMTNLSPFWSSWFPCWILSRIFRFG